MSAYGRVPPPKRNANAPPLSPRVYALPERVRADPTESRAAVLCIPFGNASGLTLPAEGKKLLRDVFNTELERGLTYPQEEAMSEDGFESYFLSYDLIVGIFLPSLPSGVQATEAGTDVSLSHALGDKVDLASLDWRKALACFYYVKPNYPGRSSHLCNAGFVVPEWNRGLGLGGVAGRSFTHYGPTLGYLGSVFNLVGASNQASLAIWKRLGFTTVGRIPGAMRLKIPDAKAGEAQEEYVDAWIIHCNFAERAAQMEAAKTEIA